MTRLPSSLVFIPGLYLLLGWVEMTTAFVPLSSTAATTTKTAPYYHGKISRSIISLSTVPSSTTTKTTPNNSRSFVLSREDVKPIIKIGSGDKEKIINGFGLWAMFVSLLTGPPWMLAMKLVERLENDQHRELFDMTGKIWAKTWLTLTNSYPTVSVRRSYDG